MGLLADVMMPNMSQVPARQNMSRPAPWRAARSHSLGAEDADRLERINKAVESIIADGQFNQQVQDWAHNALDNLLAVVKSTSKRNNTRDLSSGVLPESRMRLFVQSSHHLLSNLDRVAEHFQQESGNPIDDAFFQLKWKVKALNDQAASKARLLEGIKG